MSGVSTKKRLRMFTQEIERLGLTIERVSSNKHIKIKVRGTSGIARNLIFSMSPKNDGADRAAIKSIQRLAERINK